MKMSRFLFVLAFAITAVLTKAVSTDNETSSRMDQQMSPSSMEVPGSITPFFYLDNVMKECNKTFMIGPSFIEALEQSGSFPDETDKTPKCYVRCMLELTGVSEVDEGTYDPAQAALLFGGQTQTDDVEEMAKACMQNRVESCKCERAYQFVKCLRQMEIEKYGVQA